jgi:hypothetical protein
VAFALTGEQRQLVGDRDRRPAQRGAAISCGYDEALNW